MYTQEPSKKPPLAPLQRTFWYVVGEQLPCICSVMCSAIHTQTDCRRPMLMALFSTDADTATAPIPKQWRDHETVAEWRSDLVEAQAARTEAEAAVQDAQDAVATLKSEAEAATDTRKKRALSIRLKAARERVKDAELELAGVLDTEAEVQACQADVYAAACADLQPAVDAATADALQTYIDGLRAFIDGYEALHAVRMRVDTLKTPVLHYGRADSRAMLRFPVDLQTVPKVKTNGRGGMTALLDKLESSLEQL